MTAIQAALIAAWQWIYAIVDQVGNYEHVAASEQALVAERTWAHFTEVYAWPLAFTTWLGGAIRDLSESYLAAVFAWSKFTGRATDYLISHVLLGLIVDVGTVFGIILPHVLTPITITAGAVSVTADAVVHSRDALVAWAMLVDNSVFSLRADVWQAMQGQTDVLTGVVQWLNFLVRSDGVLRGTVLLNGLDHSGPPAVNILLGCGFDPAAADQVAAIKTRLPNLTPADVLKSFQAGSSRLDARLAPLVAKLSQ